MGNTVSLSGNTTINYIYDNNTDSKYFTINDDPTPLDNGFLIIERSNQILNEPLTVLLNFTTPITGIFNYIVINMDNIIIDGQNSTIDIDIGTNDFFSYPGLFCFDADTNNNGIVIQNISLNISDSSRITAGGGWICSAYFFNTIVNNCSTNGVISNNCGGIFGQLALNCTANNCFSTGHVSLNGGGIFGDSATNCTVNKCYSTGNLEDNSGGIFGANCNNSANSMINAICTANNCYSTGIITNSSGGIFGGNNNFTATYANCYAKNCYSLGNIINGSGGIFGAESNNTSDNSNCYAINCYSIGNLISASGGIFGVNSNISANISTCNATNCYSIGVIGYYNTNSNGGIFGAGAKQECNANFCASYGKINGDGNNQSSNGGIFGDGAEYSNANNCFSIGDIGYGSGGIFHSASHCNANFCYSIGSIGNNAGGIFGSSEYCSATYCYSIGNITGFSGGIFGNSQTGYYDLSVQSNANFCYSLGLLDSLESGGIFGSQSDNCTINNCYVLGSRLIGSNAINPTIDTYSGAEDGSWVDDHALITFNNNIDSNWFVIGGNMPFLLSSYANCANPVPIGYQFFYDLTNITAFSNNGNMPLLFLIGYYKDIQLSHDIQTGLYGYNIINQTKEVNIPINIPVYMLPLVEKTSFFNPEWF